MKPSSILSSPARDRGVADLPDQRQERILGEVARNGGARVSELTEVTNSLPVAEVLDASGRPDQTVVLSGGIRTPSDALVGPVAVRAIRSLPVASARRLVVLADHTKWQVVGLSTIAAIEQASVVITDSRLPEVAREALAARVGELILVDPEEA